MLMSAFNCLLCLTFGKREGKWSTTKLLLKVFSFEKKRILCFLRNPWPSKRWSCEKNIVFLLKIKGRVNGAEMLQINDDHRGEDGWKEGGRERGDQKNINHYKFVWKENKVGYFFLKGKTGLTNRQNNNLEYKYWPLSVATPHTHNMVILHMPPPHSANQVARNSPLISNPAIVSSCPLACVFYVERMNEWKTTPTLPVPGSSFSPPFFFWNPWGNLFICYWRRWWH